VSTPGPAGAAGGATRHAALAFEIVLENDAGILTPVAQWHEHRTGGLAEHDIDAGGVLDRGTVGDDHVGPAAARTRQVLAIGQVAVVHRAGAQWVVGKIAVLTRLVDRGDDVGHVESTPGIVGGNDVVLRRWHHPVAAAGLAVANLPGALAATGATGRAAQAGELDVLHHVIDADDVVVGTIDVEIQAPVIVMPVRGRVAGVVVV